MPEIIRIYYMYLSMYIQMQQNKHQSLNLFSKNSIFRIEVLLENLLNMWNWLVWLSQKFHMQELLNWKTDGGTSWITCHLYHRYFTDIKTCPLIVEELGIVFCWDCGRQWKSWKEREGMAGWALNILCSKYKSNEQ